MFRNYHWKGVPSKNGAGLAGLDTRRQIIKDLTPNHQDVTSLTMLFKFDHKLLKIKIQNLTFKSAAARCFLKSDPLPSFRNKLGRATVRSCPSGQREHTKSTRPGRSFFPDDNDQGKMMNQWYTPCMYTFIYIYYIYTYVQWCIYHVHGLMSHDRSDEIDLCLKYPNMGCGNKGGNLTTRSESILAPPSPGGLPRKIPGRHRCKPPLLCICRPEAAGLAFKTSHMNTIEYMYDV